MEEVGDRYFNELVSRQFFQLSSGNKSHYVVHKLLNELAVSMMKEICLGWKDDHLNISKRTRYLSLVGVHDNSVIFENYANCLTTFLTLDYKGCHLRENEPLHLFKCASYKCFLYLILISLSCPIQSVNWNIYGT